MKRPDSEVLFSQVREDPLVDLEVINNIHKNTKQALNCLIITSGGCTVLSLLPDVKVNKILSYDINIAQNELVKLKYTALNNLDTKNYLNFIQGQDSVKHYNEIKSQLTSKTRNFWDNRIDQVSFGINRIGKFEELFRDLSSRIKHHFENPFRVDFENPEHQEKWNSVFNYIYDREKLAREYGRNAVDYSTSKDFTEHFSEVFKSAVKKYSQHDNYFLDQIFEDSYLNKFPLYLENWINGSDKKLNLTSGSFLDLLDQSEDNSLDFIQLSNITDWMSNKEMNLIFRKTYTKLKINGGILCRRLNGDHALQDQVSKVFSVNIRENHKLKEMDRSFFYSEIVAGYKL